MRLRALCAAVIAVACSGAPARSQARSDDALRMPPGFKIAVFAQNLENVRFMTLGPGNVVYASQPGPGVVVKLIDANHDGVPDSVVTVASGLKGAFGIAFRGDTMYVAGELELVRYDPSVHEPKTLLRLPRSGHSTRTIVFGPYGKLYVPVGSSCNACADLASMLAAATQSNPDAACDPI